MTVKVTKPAINVREELADLRKPTGLAGEAMLRAETPQEQFNLIGAGRRNLIINGAMRVAQRGTSFTASGYTLDRWRCAFNNSSPTITQETGDTFGKSRTHLKLVTGASSTYSYVAQNIEDIAQFSGKTITVSFDYKSDNAFLCSFEYHFGSGGSPALYDKNATTISASSTVTRTSVTVTLDDISSKTIGAASTSHLDLLFNMTAPNKTLEITNVQLELGKVATPFEHRSYGEELAACQRYFYKFPVAARVGTAQRYGVSGSLVFSGLFPVEMRAIPTMASTGIPKAYNASFSADYNLNNIANSIGTDRANFACAFGGLSSGHGTGEATVMNLSAATLTADAEL